MIYDWEQTRLDAIQQFGQQTPGAKLEDDIRTVYETNPALVVAAIKRIAAQYATGSIRSPWGVLRTECQRRAENNTKVTTHRDRDKAIIRAEQWVRAAGIHYDRPSEILDELFTVERNPPGILADHDTDELRDQISTLWHELRPLGEQVEHDAIERAENWKQHSPAAHRLRKSKTPVEVGNLEPDVTEATPVT